MAIHIGPLTIKLYGIIILLGALAGAFLTRREARRRGLNPELVWDGFVWILIGGILGARLWHILTPPPSMVERGITTAYYFTHPLEALAIWHGGLGIPGAILGGVIAIFAFSRRRGLSFPVWLDIAAPALALGQAIGRWGNFVNQELYGAPTDLPWAVFIEPQNRLPGFLDQGYYHPLFLYESLWNLMNMFFLLWLGRRLADRLRPGGVFLTYLITYPFGRFMLEFLRLDSSQVAGLNINQAIMAVVVCAALLTLLLRRRKDASRQRAAGAVSVDR